MCELKSSIDRKSYFMGRTIPPMQRQNQAAVLLEEDDQYFDEILIYG